MEKLELLPQFIKKYREQINPELLSIKYCQTETDAYAELSFRSNPLNPDMINLNFIHDDFDQDEIDEMHQIPLLFKPNADIVDNANLLVELDPYSLINCIGGLFTNEAEIKINDDFQRNQGT